MIPAGPLSTGRDLSAIKRSDKAAMFICGDRGVAKREERRVEGEIYLPAARADKIIRQKTPGVDDGEARRGGWKRGSRTEPRDQVRTRGGGKSEEETNTGDGAREAGGRGREGRAADAEDAAARTKGGRARAQGRPEKEETGQECTDECVVLRATQPRRLSCERVSELSLESPLCLARPAVRNRERPSSRAYTCERSGITVYYISVICVYRGIGTRTRHAIAVCLSISPMGGLITSILRESRSTFCSSRGYTWRVTT